MNEATVRALIRRFGGGSVPDGTYGDITVSGGTWSINANAVDTAEIADGAVTFAKLDGAAVITSGETIAANDNDTTVPTSAAVKDYADIAFTGPVATTSGAAVDLSTVIPTGARRITVLLRGVSTSSTSQLRIRIGDGAFATSGYLSTAWGNNTSVTTATDAFVLTANAGAASVFNGEIRLTHVGGNNWVLAGNVAASGAQVSVATGQVSLAGVLDRVQLHLTTGAFDLGEAAIMWEF